MLVKCISSKYCNMLQCIHYGLHEYNETCDNKECVALEGWNGPYPRCGIPVKTLKTLRRGVPI